MFKKMEFARPVDDPTGADKKKPGVVHPFEVQRRLDEVLATAEKTETEDERIAALEDYRKMVEEVGGELKERQRERMKLVDFNGEMIHNFELQALKKIVEQINEDYAGQRLADKSFDLEDVKIDDLVIEIENEEVIKIDLDNNKLTKIPTAVGELLNLQTLLLSNNQITKISGLDNLRNLQELGLGYNQIREIGGLDNLTNLQVLGLTKNQLTVISGLDNLTNLQEIWLDANQIISISGLDKLANLQNLWLQDNQISEISGLNNLIKLQALGLGRNRMDKTEDKTKEQIMALEGRDVSVNI